MLNYSNNAESLILWNYNMNYDSVIADRAMIVCLFFDNGIPCKKIYFLNSKE